MIGWLAYLRAFHVQAAIQALQSAHAQHLHMEAATQTQNAQYQGYTLYIHMNANIDTFTSH